MPTSVLLTDYVGPGDFYFLDAPSFEYQITARTLLHSTDGRVFLATDDKPRLTFWLGTTASSQGLTTVHYTTAATNGIISLEGTIRNSHAEGTAVRIWGAGSTIYTYEAGAIIAKGANGIGIQLSVDSAQTTARITNDGVISAYRPIERNGSENVSLTNNGNISASGGASYRDTFGGVDTILNKGIMSGRIEFGGGSDSYDGRLGRLFGGVNGGDGNDSLFGGVYAEYILGGTGIDTLSGGGGDDTLLGGANADFLYGGDGKDRLNSEGGGDRMDGGLDDDFYDVNTDDTILEAVGGGNDRAIVYNGDTFRLAAGVSIETLELWANAACNTLVGNELAQTIIGNGAANSLSGGGGNDTLIGGAGVDRLFGGTGNDAFVVDNTGDVTSEAAGQGSDIVYTSVSYTLVAGQEIERLATTSQAGTTAINLTGNALGQQLNGNAGANTLNGGGGGDTLSGFGGNDRLIGGTGLDVLTGGNGYDIFAFGATSESGITLASADRITAFAGDRIDVSLIDANAAAAGNQAFTLDLGGAFSAGEVRQSQSGADRLIEFNTDADAAPEMAILVLSHGAFVANDFFL